jgi:hypothetical protein
VTLKASRQGQAAGFARQGWIQDVLNERLGWSLAETRQLLKNRSGNINFQEKIVGDLIEVERDVSIEVQTSESPSPNVLWKKSKYLHSAARWQCFVYDLQTPVPYSLFVRTDELKYILGPIEQVRWERYDNDSAVALWHHFLRGEGAKTLDEFITLYS